MPTSEEINRLTEGVYRHTTENLNPAIRHMIAMGRSYEKALVGVSLAARSYFESIVKLGELASETKASRQLGEVMLQIAATLRDIETQRELAVHSFHKELLIPLESTVDQLHKDISNKQKNYLQNNKVKSESVEKARNEYKKVQKKSQKNVAKYTDKERKCEYDYLQKQQDLDEYRVQGLKDAWKEERRRYCFLILRQCEVMKSSTVYHGNAHSLYRHRIPDWNSACDKPNQMPPECDNVLQMFRQGIAADGNDTRVMEVEVPRRQHYGRNIAMYGSDSVFNQGDSPQINEELDEPLTVDIGPGPVMPYPSATLPNPKKQNKQSPAMRQHTPQTYSVFGKYSSIFSKRIRVPGRRHSSNESTLRHHKHSITEGNGVSGHVRNRSDGTTDILLAGGNQVCALYTHTASGKNQLSFSEGDVITVIGEKKNGWQFGQNMNSNKVGWFPIAYTESNIPGLQRGNVQDLPEMKQRYRSEGNLLELDGSFPMPDYNRDPRQSVPPPPPPPNDYSGGLLKTADQPTHHHHQQLFGESQTPNRHQNGSIVPPSSQERLFSQLPSSNDATSDVPSQSNPFAQVKLRRTITNDRSAPAI